jgi:hypothetical protein
VRTRANEKTYPDVGGGFVEPHPRGDDIDWGEAYPYKGTDAPMAELRSQLGAGGEAARGELGGREGSSGARAGRARGELGGSSGLERVEKYTRFAERFTR